MVFPIAGGNESKGYEVENSLRFNDDDSPNLTVAQVVLLQTVLDGLGAFGFKGLTGKMLVRTIFSSYNGTNTDRIQFTEDDQLHT